MRDLRNITTELNVNQCLSSSISENVDMSLNVMQVWKGILLRHRPSHFGSHSFSYTSAICCRINTNQISRAIFSFPVVLQGQIILRLVTGIGLEKKNLMKLKTKSWLVKNYLSIPPERYVSCPWYKTSTYTHFVSIGTESKAGHDDQCGEKLHFDTIFCFFIFGENNPALHNFPSLSKEHLGDFVVSLMILQRYSCRLEALFSPIIECCC